MVSPLDPLEAKLVSFRGRLEAPSRLPPDWKEPPELDEKLEDKPLEMPDWKALDTPEIPDERPEEASPLLKSVGPPEVWPLLMPDA